MAKITKLNQAKVVSAHGLLRIKICSKFLYIKFSELTFTISKIQKIYTDC